MSFLFLTVSLALFACAHATDGAEAANNVSNILVRGIAPALLTPAFDELWDRVSRFLVVYANARHNVSCALHVAIKVRKFRRDPSDVARARDEKKKEKKCFFRFFRALRGAPALFPSGVAVLCPFRPFGSY